MIRIPKSQYAELYGPTTGDRIRLADTELWIEIERDHTVYGDEVCFGGGKVIRDGMGQSQISNADGAMDTVITNGRHHGCGAGHHQGRSWHTRRAHCRPSARRATPMCSPMWT